MTRVENESLRKLDEIGNEIPSVARDQEGAMQNQYRKPQVIGLGNAVQLVQGSPRGRFRDRIAGYRDEP